MLYIAKTLPIWDISVNIELNKNLVCTLFLLPIFFVNIDLGSEGEFFLKFQFILYPLLCLYLIQVGLIKIYHLAAFLVVVISVSSIYLPYYFYHDINNIFNSFFYCTLFFFYVFISIFMGKAMFIKGFESSFFDKFDKLVWISIGTIYLSYFLYLLTGFYFLADDGYGLFRPHAFFSEPSALAPFIAYTIISSLMKMNVKKLLLALPALYLLTSLISFLTLAFSLLFVFIRRRGALFQIVALVLSFLLILIAYYYIMNYVPTGEGVLDSQTIKLKRGIEAVVYSGQEGYNPRYNTLMDLIGYLDVHERNLIGFGPLSDNFVNFSEIAASASTIYLMIYFNFGFVVLLFFTLLTLCIFKVDLKKASRLDLLLVCFLINAAINSAQGILIYQIVFIAIYAVIKRSTYEKNYIFRSKM